MSLKSEMKYVFLGVTSRVAVDDGLDGGLLEVGGPLGLLDHLLVVGVLVLADVPVSYVCNGVDVLDPVEAIQILQDVPDLGPPYGLYTILPMLSPFPL